MWHNRFHAEQAANGFMRIGGGHWLSVKVVKLCAPLGTASRCTQISRGLIAWGYFSDDADMPSTQMVSSVPDHGFGLP